MARDLWQRHDAVGPLAGNRYLHRRQSFREDGAGSSWGLTLDKLDGLPVRTAIAADVLTGVQAAARHQPTMDETRHMPGSRLIDEAWGRITQPIVRLFTRPGDSQAGRPGLTLAPKPLIRPDELQSLLAEPDTALIIAPNTRIDGAPAWPAAT